MVVPPLAALAAPGHLALVLGLSGRAHLDGRVLQCCGLQRHLVATLECFRNTKRKRVR